PAGERFDSEIFNQMPLTDTGPLLEPVPYGRTSQVTPPFDSAGDAGDSPASNETADLLEALRRRRGEREPAPHEEDFSRSNHPSTGSIRLVSDDDTDAAAEDSEKTASIHLFPGTGEVPRGIAGQTSGDSTDDADQPADPVAPTKPASKRGRPEMPSWDDIVFGTKPDDDPA
ncbi:MAG: hypothetical protein WD400_02460, partial [Pontimonas sp.]